ncbi:MAG: hypothetical protein RL595_3449 [Planctomycetota bacterium]|jgi:hypothetical protein
MENNFKPKKFISTAVGEEAHVGADLAKQIRQDSIGKKVSALHKKGVVPYGNIQNPKNSNTQNAKMKYEAGIGTVPSGTNTHLPGKYGKRKDGSFGIC